MLMADLSGGQRFLFFSDLFRLGLSYFLLNISSLHGPFQVSVEGHPAPEASGDSRTQIGQLESQPIYTFAGTRNLVETVTARQYADHSQKLILAAVTQQGRAVLGSISGDKQLEVQHEIFDSTPENPEYGWAGIDLHPKDPTQVVIGRYFQKSATIYQEGRLVRSFASCQSPCHVKFVPGEV